MTRIDPSTGHQPPPATDVWFEEGRRRAASDTTGFTPMDAEPVEMTPQQEQRTTWRAIGMFLTLVLILGGALGVIWGVFQVATGGWKP